LTLPRKTPHLMARSRWGLVAAAICLLGTCHAARTAHVAGNVEVLKHASQGAPQWVTRSTAWIGTLRRAQAAAKTSHRLSRMPPVHALSDPLELTRMATAAVEGIAVVLGTPLVALSAAKVMKKRRLALDVERRQEKRKIREQAEAMAKAKVAEQEARKREEKQAQLDIRIAEARAEEERLRVNKEMARRAEEERRQAELIAEEKVKISDARTEAEVKVAEQEEQAKVDQANARAKAEEERHQAEEEKARAARAKSHAEERAKKDAAQAVAEEGARARALEEEMEAAVEQARLAEAHAKAEQEAQAKAEEGRIARIEAAEEASAKVEAKAKAQMQEQEQKAQEAAKTARMVKEAKVNVPVQARASKAADSDMEKVGHALRETLQGDQKEAKRIAKELTVSSLKHVIRTHGGAPLKAKSRKAEYVQAALDAVSESTDSWGKVSKVLSEVLKRQARSSSRG